MGGSKIKSKDDNLSIVDLEDKDNILEFFGIIRKEYFRHFFKVNFLIIFLFVIYIVVQTLSNHFLPYDWGFILNSVVIWILFLIYLVIHFFQLSTTKFSPTVVNFLKRELFKVDFEIQKKYKTEESFFLFNSFSILIFLLFNFMMYYSNNEFTTSLIIRLITIYIFSSIIIPSVLGVLHDKFLVKLKNQYFIKIDLQFKLIKHKEVESKMIRIYMTSNRLCLKSNRRGFILHKEISAKRWLPKKRNLISLAIYRRSYLQFHEFSTFINIKEHFLNLVSAIREWDLSFINS